VPRDGFALAVRVGGEDQALGALYGGGNVVKALGGLGINFPGHRKIFVRFYRPVLGRQVAHMAKGGDHLIAGAQIFVDRFGLGRRLDDDDIHCATKYFRR